MQITKKRRIVRIRSHEQVPSHCTLLGRMRDVVRRICLERPGYRNGLFFLGGPPRPVCGSDRTALAARTNGASPGGYRQWYLFWRDGIQRKSGPPHRWFGKWKRGGPGRLPKGKSKGKSHGGCGAL